MTEQGGVERLGGGMPRRHLLSKLAEARVSVVLAPAGSGKSTLLTQYAGEFDRCVWVEVDESDRSPQSLQRLLAASSEGSIGYDEDGWTVDAQGPGLLVVDDAHALANSDSARLLLDLLWVLPQNWSAALAARTGDGLGLAQLEIHPSCTTLTWEHLRFGLREIERLFATHYRFRLPASELPLLARNTGGWATALYLFYVAARNDPERRLDLIARLQSQDLALRQYLTQQVLGDLTEQEMQTLAQLAVFEYMRGDLIADMLGSGGVEVMAKVHEMGLLSATGIPDEYQLHRLLRDQLLERLATDEGHRGLSEAYRRAAAVLEQRGELGQAARAYLRGGKIDDVTRLGGAGFSALRQSELDDGVAGDQWALWTEGILELRRGAISSAARLLGRSRSEFDTVPSELYQLSSELDAWLNPPTVPEPARPMGALHRWLAGDDTMSELLAADGSLAGTIYRAISQSLERGEPVWPDYRGTDRTIQLVVGLVGVFIQLLMRGGPFARSLRQLELLLQTGVHCAALERILIGVSIPWMATARTPTSEASLMAHLVAEANGDGDLLGSGILRVVDGVRNDREGVPQLLDQLGLARAVDLLGNVDGQPGPRRRHRGESEGFAVRLLGPFELAGLDRATDQQPLRPQHRNVLQALALHAAQWVHRDRLLEWFWPDVDRTVGSKRLATAISAIRRSLELAGNGAAVHKHHESYTLDPGEGSSDLALLVSHLGTVEIEARSGHDAAIGLIRHCLHLQRGPLLVDSVGGKWLDEARWELDGRWERALVALLVPGTEGEHDPLLELLPELVTMAARSDNVWQLAISCAEGSDSPLLAAQLRNRYDQLVGAIL